MGFLVSTVLPSFSAFALLRSRSFLAALSSGRYFNSILNKLVAASTFGPLLSLNGDHMKRKKIAHKTLNPIHPSLLTTYRTGEERQTVLQGKGTLTEIFVQGFGELVERRRNLEALVQHPPLSLYPHIFGPFHESVQIPLRRQSTSNPELFGPFLEQGISYLRRLLGSLRQVT